ncbi:MAG: alpha/beta hydrolase family esterase [Actinomycetota bacterium]
MSKRISHFLPLFGLVAAMMAPARQAQATAGAQPNGDALGGGSLMRREWTLEGVSREALLAIPRTAATSATPVVFAFHGHGGTMRSAANSFGYHRAWPEAIVVYPQGLNTPGLLTDREGKKPGWQRVAGDQNDRDLKLFDAMLATLEKEYRVDKRRIYATGHSNGGGFTYLLWAARGDSLAAVAPSAATAPRSLRGLKPKPVLHLAGEKDELVRFAWQERTINYLRRLNDCGEGLPWMEVGTLYPSKSGTPVVTYVHPGGHQFPREAPPLVVRFFKEHPQQ